MSVAFYVVLDNDNPGFDTFVNGKALAKDAKKLGGISKKLGIPTFDDFIAMSADEIADMLGDDVEIPEQEEKWFAADEGIVFINSMADYVRSNPGSVKSPQEVLDELGELADVLSKAKEIGARWHLSLDI